MSTKAPSCVAVPMARVSSHSLGAVPAGIAAGVVLRVACRDPPAPLEPVTGPEQGALREVVSRFLRTYLAGDAAGLAYLDPRGPGSSRRRRAATSSSRSTCSLKPRR